MGPDWGSLLTEMAPLIDPCSLCCPPEVRGLEMIRRQRCWGVTFRARLLGGNGVPLKWLPSPIIQSRWDFSVCVCVCVCACVCVRACVHACVSVCVSYRFRGSSRWQTSAVKLIRYAVAVRPKPHWFSEGNRWCSKPLSLQHIHTSASRHTNSDK